MEPIQIDLKPSKKSTKASRFVAKLSPKKFQRKRGVTKIATMKVRLFNERFFFILFKFIFKIKNFKKKLKSCFLKIYSNELEAQAEFNGFREWLLPFDLYRGKKTGDDIEDEARTVGTFKVTRYTHYKFIINLTEYYCNMYRNKS